MKIAIVTATYNRSKTLSRLFDSLQRQTRKDFDWLVSDDGSTDDTELLIRNFTGECSFHKVVYCYHENMGKSKCVEYCLKKYSEYDFYVVIDSDDYLLSNAIEVIHSTIENVRDEKDRQIGIVRFKMVDGDGRPLITRNGNSKRELSGVHSVYECSKAKYKQEERFSGIFGWYGRLYTFPTFEAEKFITEVNLTICLADEGLIFFSEAVIGIAEYQKDGITASGRRLRINNPFGSIYTCLNMVGKKWPISIRAKNQLLARAYMTAAGLTKRDLLNHRIDANALSLWSILPGYLLGRIWIRKYL